MKHTYDALMLEAAKLGETNDCAVRALAVAAGITYGEAHTLLAENGRKPRSATGDKALLGALLDSGLAARRRAIRRKPTATGITDPTWSMIASWMRELSRRQKSAVIIRTTRHVFAVDSGHVIDWITDKDRRRVREFWLLESVW